MHIHRDREFDEVTYSIASLVGAGLTRQVTTALAYRHTHTYMYRHVYTQLLFLPEGAHACTHSSRNGTSRKLRRVGHTKRQRHLTDTMRAIEYIPTHYLYTTELRLFRYPTL